MFHLAGYYGSIAAVANTNCPAIVDDVLTIQNAHFMLTQPRDLLFAYAGSPLLDRARINSPTFRAFSPSFIWPINLDDSIPANPGVADYRDNPLRIPPLEEIAVEVTNTAAGPSDTFALLGLQSVYEPVPRGNIYTLRGTSTTATVADVWTTAVFAWADTLPDGNYVVVGGMQYSATAVAFRLIFDNQIDRPGCIASVLATGDQWPPQGKGGLGVWGHFRPCAMPQVQLLNTAAVAVHTILLDIMRVA